MKHAHMLWLCGGMIGLGIILAATGAGAVAFLAPLGCAVMMIGMVWMMVRMGRHH